MVSRRKILSRSRDDLNLDQTFVQQEEEEDVWYQKEKLFKVSVNYIKMYMDYELWYETETERLWVYGQEARQRSLSNRETTRNKKKL